MPPINALRQTYSCVDVPPCGWPDHARDVYCICPDCFVAQMRALAEAGYRAISIEDFDAWRRGEKSLPENSFVLTFDDGFTSVHDFAAPVLKTLGWPATVFLVAGKLGRKSDRELKFCVSHNVYAEMMPTGTDSVIALKHQASLGSNDGRLGQMQCYGGSRLLASLGNG